LELKIDFNYNQKVLIANGLIRAKIIIFKKNRSVETKNDFYSPNGSVEIRNDLEKI